MGFACPRHCSSSFQDSGLPFDFSLTPEKNAAFANQTCSPLGAAWGGNDQLISTQQPQRPCGSHAAGAWLEGPDSRIMDKLNQIKQENPKSLNKDVSGGF